MDKKASEILGLPVIARNSGARIHRVTDMIIDPERRQVLALVVEERELLRSTRAVPLWTYSCDWA